MIDIISELKTIFSLPADASDEELLAAATRGAAAEKAFHTRDEEETAVNQLIRQSAGALNAKSARRVLEQRGAFRLQQIAKRTTQTRQ